MSAIREVGMKRPDLRPQWAASVQKPTQTIGDRFKRLVLKDKPVSRSVRLQKHIDKAYKKLYK